ncbi:hypothetical protein F4819DRAFT_479223 [Hypoxylon fuscum]|nr:hypothetical protein F4819DRAFT_479223 [Hypoxylon fuscum]
MDYSRNESRELGMLGMIRQLVEIAGRVEQRLDTVERTIHALLNRTARLQNFQRLSGNPAAILLPLRNPQTGSSIPNCPTTINQIRNLPADRATEILHILQVPVPSSLRDKIKEVLYYFTGREYHL